MDDRLMWATTYMGPQHLSFRQVPIPEIGPEDMLVRVRVALTCGTDVKT